MPWSPAPARSSWSSSDGSVRDSYAWSTPWAMSGDCLSIALMTAQESALKPRFASV
jgi:hypothetical protein